MSIYSNIIMFNNETNYDYELIVAHFEPDVGEVDTYLSLEPIFTDSYDGTDTNDYGAKYITKATPQITFVERDGGDIPPGKVRKVLRWLTGQRGISWMSLLDDDGNEVCSYRGRFTSVNQHKLDDRVIGLVCQFTATSPWALSPVQEITKSIISSGTSFTVQNDSDDLYTVIYPDITFENKKSGANFVLKNDASEKGTEFSNLSYDEKVTIESNLIVYSSANRLFKNDFNFEFPQLFPGVNKFQAFGTGTLNIKFRYPMKFGTNDEFEFTNNPIPTSVHNNNLTIEHSGKECPFDLRDAKVVDGELIIKNDLQDISSEQVEVVW